MKAALSAMLLCAALAMAQAADDLVLLRDGKSDYQIVVPDNSPTDELAASLRQCARLLQTACGRLRCRGNFGGISGPRGSTWTARFGPRGSGT